MPLHQAAEMALLIYETVMGTEAGVISFMG